MRLLAIQLVLLTTTVSEAPDWVPLQFEPLSEMPAVDADVVASVLEREDSFDPVFKEVRSRCIALYGTPLFDDVALRFFFRIRAKTDGTYEAVRVDATEARFVGGHVFKRALTEEQLMHCAFEAVRKAKPGPTRRFTVLFDIAWNRYSSTSRWNDFLRYLNPIKHGCACVSFCDFFSPDCLTIPTLEKAGAGAVLCAACLAFPLNPPLVCLCGGLASLDVHESVCSTSEPGCVGSTAAMLRLSFDDKETVTTKAATSADAFVGNRVWVRRLAAPTAPLNWVLEHRVEKRLHPETAPLVPVVALSISGWPDSITEEWKRKELERLIRADLTDAAGRALFRKDSAFIGDDGIVVAMSASATAVVEPHGVVYIVKNVEGSPFLKGRLPNTYAGRPFPSAPEAYELQIRVSLDYEAVATASAYPFDEVWDPARPPDAGHDEASSLPVAPGPPVSTSPAESGFSY